MATITTPNDIRAERDILKSCFSGRYTKEVTNRLVTELTASHFTHPSAREIYMAITEAQYDTSGEGIAWQEVRNYINESSEARSSLKNMAEEDVNYSQTYLDKAFDNLHSTYKARVLRQLAGDAENMAKLGHTEKAIEGLLDGVYGLVRDPHASGAQYVDSYIPDALADIDQRRNNDGLVGLETGIAPIDDLLGGLQDHRFIVLAARPGHYKSTALGQIAINIAKSGTPAMICSTEMAAQDYILRYAVPEAKVDYGMYSRGKFTDEEEDRIKDMVLLMKSKKLIINQAGEQTTTTIRQDVIRHQPAALFVDYLQEVQPKNPQENEYKDVTATARELNALKKMFNMPVMVAAQLNREVEKRDPWDRRPVMSDLRASGWVEQLADHIFFLYHPYKYHREGGYDDNVGEHYFEKGSGKNVERVYYDSELVEWVCGKNRFGEAKDYETFVSAKYLKLRNNKREWFE